MEKAVFGFTKSKIKKYVLLTMNNNTVFDYIHIILTRILTSIARRC